MENKKLAAALYYLNKCGFSVIPAKEDKKPYIQWQQFQKEQPSESMVKKWWDEQYRFANIAIITGKVSDLTVIDIDTPEGKTKIEESIPESFITPIVDTPSGGEHIYCKYQDGIGNAVRFMAGADIRSEGGYVIAPPSSDARGAWKWREGCKIGGVDIAPMPSSVLKIINAFSLSFPRARDANSMPSALQSVTSVTRRYMSFDEGSRDESLFHLANCLIKGGMPIQEIEEFLKLISYKLCNPPFSEKDIPIKIKSALKRVETKERNLHQEILEWLALQEGYISVTECDRELQIVTKELKRNRRVIIHRLVKTGILMKTEYSGKYRVPTKDWIEEDAGAINSGKPLNIRLPFFLDHYVEILPGDLIVIAGTPNSGKTALLLDTVAHNMYKWDCWYFSTEMGPNAWARRRDKRDPPLDWKFKFVHGFSNYEDIIKPNDMNFIDYVEQNEGEAFKIPGILAKIQRKLKKGVALVALQKNKGTEWGIGGQQTTAKPALFCTVETNYPHGAKIRVVKAKAFKEYNPNGFCCNFKIIKGINLLETGGWAPE